jgi:predicted O-methyltransferase YrrM
MREGGSAADPRTYLEQLLPDRDPILLRLESEAEAEGIPIVGPYEGAFLHLLARVSRPELIVELGTATGYSGIWLLRGAPAGVLVTFELDNLRAGRARRAFSEAGLIGRVDLRETNAVEGIEGIEAESAGLVFNDILFGLRDEARVEQCFRGSLALLRRGGLLVADNAAGEEILDADSLPGRCARRWNSLVREAPGLTSVAVPIGGGVSVAWKGTAADS